MAVSIVSLLVAAFACWLAYELLRQSGRIVVRLEAVERCLEDFQAATVSPEPTRAAAATLGTSHRGTLSLAHSRIKRNGLAAGTPAPLFTLPVVGGGELALHELRGRRALLVFSDPDCGPCDVLAPQLEQFHRRTREVTVVMVSRGTVEANRHKVRRHRLTFPVVLQRHWEISRLYGMFATPIAYLIDEDGVISTSVAVGPGPILDLLARAATSLPRKATVAGRQEAVGLH